MSEADQNPSPAPKQTARELLQLQSKIAKDVVAARLPDGTLIDLHTPTTATSATPVTSSDPAALAIIRHSSAHVMADAVQRLYPGTKVAFGPATENGFYYDYDRKEGSFSDEELRVIEKKMAEIIARDVPFSRRTVTADEARELLSRTNETYKLEHLERLLSMGEEISIYQHGDWIDLCEGPHVPSTKFLSAFKLTTVAGAYWRGDEKNPMLQRIYGTAFASKKELDAYVVQMEEAKKRDHRKLGKELELFAFHPWAPASPFFLPRGAYVYNALVQYVRNLYVKFGYDEVITPQVFDRELFLTSGHLPAYAEGMFLATTMENIEEICERLVKAGADTEGQLDAASVESHLREETRFGLKPMNCPAHALMFGMTRRSYRELPMRMADFGRLHRFERSGVTQGLTRVRTFCQDDGHVFCTLEQVPSEIGAFIDLVYSVYKDFDFGEVRVVIATRPETRFGDDAFWDRAEGALIEGVKSKGLAYEIAENEGAFYGPKIEFHLKDAIGRSWQLGTMQYDENLPERFDLNYVSNDNSQPRPVMLHRAILGSLERFLGVLIEHVSGSFPTWMAPEQIALLTVSDRFDDYAKEAASILEGAGFRVKLDLSGDKLGAKIRNARNMRIPYLGVIGDKEVEERGLAIRSRDLNADLGMLPLSEVLSRLSEESKPPSLRTRS